MTRNTALCCCVVALTALAVSATAIDNDHGGKDLLLIAIDDLRPQLACTEVPGTIRPKMSTPCSTSSEAKRRHV